MTHWLKFKHGTIQYHNNLNPLSVLSPSFEMLEFQKKNIGYDNGLKIVDLF